MQKTVLSLLHKMGAVASTIELPLAPDELKTKMKAAVCKAAVLVGKADAMKKAELKQIELEAETFEKEYSELVITIKKSVDVLETKREAQAGISKKETNSAAYATRKARDSIYIFCVASVTAMTILSTSSCDGVVAGIKEHIHISIGLGNSLCHVMNAN